MSTTIHKNVPRLLCLFAAAFLPAQAMAKNLSIGAGADGSSKGGGTSYGRVIDGKADSVWSPAGTQNERVCVKWADEQTIKRVVLRESGSAVTAWRLEQAGRGAEVVAKGEKIGAEHAVDFATPIASKKICLVIESADSPPAIAEFETY